MLELDDVVELDDALVESDFVSVFAVELVVEAELDELEELELEELLSPDFAGAP